MKKILFVIQLMLLSHLIFAQTEGKPEWSVQLPTPCDWMQLTSAGTVIVSTKFSLMGIDPATKQKVWEVKLVNPVKEEDYQEIEGTPFATFESFNPLQGLRAKTTIIDYVTGRVIFDSKEADIKILKKTPVFDIEGMLLEYREDKKYYVSFLNVLEGVEKWKVEISGEAYGQGGIGIGSMIKMAKALFLAQPILDGDGNILFPDFKILKRIDAKTGKVLWEQTYEKNLKRLTLSNDGKTVYLGAGRKIMGANVSDGKELWTKAYKMKGDFEAFIPIDNDKMYLLSAAEITVIDKKTGQSIWKKPYDFNSQFRDVRITDNGLVILSDNNGLKNNSYFHYVNSTGKPIWKKPYETNEQVINFKVTSAGVLFTDSKEANLIDMKTAKDRWKKRIKVKGTPIAKFDENTAFIFTDGSLYEINLGDGSYKEIVEKIDLKGKDEAVNKIEVLSNGYLLSSSQNMVLVGKDGKIIYQKYYKPANFGGTFGKILSVTAQIVVGVNELEVVQETSSTGYTTNTIQVSERGRAINSGIREFARSRKNSFSTLDAKYILTMVEEDDRKYIGMVKVDKATGEEKGNIVLRTLDPVYVIDYVGGKLYSTSGNNGLVSLQFSCFGL